MICTTQEGERPCCPSTSSTPVQPHSRPGWHAAAGRDAILLAPAPDIGCTVRVGFGQAGFALLFHGHAIDHGGFHSRVVLAVFAVAVAFVLHPPCVGCVDSVVAASLAYAAHIAEDALVQARGIDMLWPLSGDPAGLDRSPDNRAILNLASPDASRTAIAIHCHIDGFGWICGHPLVRMLGRANRPIGKPPDGTETQRHARLVLRPALPHPCGRPPAHCNCFHAERPMLIIDGDLP